MEGNVLEPARKTVKPYQPPRAVIDLETVDGLHPLYMERTNTMSNLTSPNGRKAEFTVEERDDKFVIFSRVYPLFKDGHGSSITYVAEKDSMAEAEELIGRLKRL